MQPDISVIIPTYNRKEYLKKAIQSCFNGNENIEVEVIVVDYGSTDKTQQYLESLNDNRIKPIFQRHKGAQIARNIGSKAAKGWAIKHLDDDDYLLPGALAKQFQFLKQTGIPCCYGDVKVKFEETDKIKSREFLHHNDLINAITTGGVPRWNLLFLFRKDTMQNIKWDTTLIHFHILDFLLKVARKNSRCGKLNKVVAVHRIHQNQRESNKVDRIPKINLLNQELNMFYKYCDVMKNEQKEAVLNICWQLMYRMFVYDFNYTLTEFKALQQNYPAFKPKRDNLLLKLLDRLFNPIMSEKLVFFPRKLKHLLKIN